MQFCIKTLNIKIKRVSGFRDVACVGLGLCCYSLLFSYRTRGVSSFTTRCSSGGSGKVAAAARVSAQRCVSRVESLMVDEVVSSVHSIMNAKGGYSHTYIAVERVTFSELFAAVEEH